MDIGTKIKKARNKNGITQQNLADSIGKSVNTIKKYESNYTTPPTEVLQKIATILHLNLWDFISDDFKEYDSYCDEDKDYLYKLAAESNLMERVLEGFGYSIESHPNSDNSFMIYLVLKDGRKIKLNIEDINNIKEAIENTINFEIQRLLKRGWING